ncbi:MAG: anthranilate phosphoribosyltransferase [Phycisphaeraceae bacterium]
MKDLLTQLLDGQTLSLGQATDAFEQIMSGRATPVQTGALLALIQTRGATVEELTGAATVMRQKAAKVKPPEGVTVVDTCGTGGDGAGTFNISTAAALVTAGAGRERGVVVAKHGNRSVTSRSGSSQVLEALGVTLACPPDVLTRCMAEAGIAFCFAPAHHPAMKHAAPVRAELGFRTLFNLVGPLTNPAGATRQVIGVFHEQLTDTLAEVLQSLGSERAMVVCGQLPADAHGRVVTLDELSTAGPSKITHLRTDPAGSTLETQRLDPADLDLPFSHPSSMRVDSPEASAAMIRGVLAGDHGPARDIVLLNAAAALVVAALAHDLQEGLTLAAQAIDTGKARQALDTLVRITGEAAA